MNDTPTPETTSALIEGIWHNGHRLVHEKVCAKLERERDEARSKNTQLRKVADELVSAEKCPNCHFGHSWTWGSWL